MPVRSTENSLPDGVLNWEDLGQADKNGNFKLVSYLTQPLRYEKDKKPLNNTYVVFDTRNLVNTGDPSGYRWKFKIEFKFEVEVDGEIEVQEGELEFSELQGIEGGAVFNLNSEKTVFNYNSEEKVFKKIFEDKHITKITTTVAVDGTVANNLELEQTVKGLNNEIEDLLGSSEFKNGAIAGDPQTTRIMANDYREYLLALEKSKDDTELKKISINLIATLLYQKIENSEGEDPDLEKWKNYINYPDGFDLNDLIGTNIGVLSAKPHVFHFFTKDLADGDSLENYVFDEDGESSMDQYEHDLLTAITDTDEKRDLVNILRFPKASIFASWKYLKNLKERHAAILNNIMDIENHPDNKACISTIVTEHETVPRKKDFDDFSSTAEQAFDIMYTEWMQAILFKSEILMAPISIKVLDIRSGNVIASEKIRKITVAETVAGLANSYTYTAEVDNALLNDSDKRELRKYLRECDLIPNNLSALESAQRALFRMGYAPGASYQKTAAQNSYDLLENHWSDNNWDPDVAAAYNLYWRERLLDNYMHSGNNAADKPRSFYLNEIKRDYNKISSTNDEGVLEVRIAKEFLDDKKVHIDIQFWQIPIAREEIDDDSGDPISRESSDENVPTEFVISWEGGAGFNQRILWSDYINNNQIVVAPPPGPEFGWEVSKDDLRSKIRPVQRLIVKDDEDEFEEYDSSLLSTFYDSDSYPMHFVLFGLVWCQPLVDGVEDNFDGPHRSNRRVFRNRTNPDGSWVENLGMHLVTKYKGSSNYRYGFYDRMNAESTASGQLGQHNYRGSAHDSADIYSGSLAIGVMDCFASHGGKFIFGPNSAGYGNNNVFIEFKNPYSYNADNRYKLFRYMHLSFKELLNNEIIQAGTVIGQTGRGGNFEPVSPSHLHLEIMNRDQPVHVSSMEPSQYLAINDPLNTKCLPGNDLPLLLPCAAIYDYAAGSADDPTNCSFMNSNVVTDCWAVQKFPDYDYQANRIFPNEEFPEQVVTNGVHMFACPFVHFESPVSFDVFWVQAHLKYVFVNRGLGVVPNVDYHNPGRIDDSIDVSPVNVEINLQVGDVVNILGTDNDRKQVRVQKGAINGWLLNIPTFIVGNTMQVGLKYIATNKITYNTNVAIGVYRALTPDINFNLNDYASNFNIDINLINNLRGKMVVYEDV